MTWYEYEQLSAYDAPSGAIARNAVGQVYATTDTTFTTPLPVRDLADVPMTSLTSNNDGIIPPFKVEDHKVVNWKSGPYIFPVASIEGFILDNEAAVSAAQAAQAAAEDAASRSALPARIAVGNVVTETATGWASLPPTGGSGGTTIEGAPAVWPSTFPPTSHSHTTSDLRNTSAAPLATPVANLLNAGDQAAARAAIGAGTGNGTSNLTLGTTATTAMPGNKVFGANEVTVTPTTDLPQTNVQAALNDLATRAGSGASNIMVVVYRSGAYPALPSTKPAGVSLVLFKGPVQPTGLPSWIGVGPTQVLSEYEIAATS